MAADRYYDDYSRADRRDTFGAAGMWSGGSHSFSGDVGAALGASLRRPQWEISQLPKFEKNFYQEHPDVKKMSSSEAETYRKSKDITVHGRDIPKPVRSFEEASFPGLSCLIYSCCSFSSSHFLSQKPFFVSCTVLVSLDRLQFKHKAGLWLLVVVIWFVDPLVFQSFANHSNFPFRSVWLRLAPAKLSHSFCQRSFTSALSRF